MTEPKAKITLENFGKSLNSQRVYINGIEMSHVISASLSHQAGSLPVLTLEIFPTEVEFISTNYRVKNVLDRSEKNKERLENQEGEGND